MAGKRDPDGDLTIAIGKPQGGAAVDAALAALIVPG
jgi:hypothetical protein